MTSLTELAQSHIEPFKGIGGRLVLSLRYLFATEVHVHAPSPRLRLLDSRQCVSLFLSVHTPLAHGLSPMAALGERLPRDPGTFADSLACGSGFHHSESYPARASASQASTHLRGHALFHQFGGLPALGSRAEPGVGYSAEPQFSEEPGYVLLSGGGDGSYGVSFDSPLHRRAMGAHLHPRMDPVPRGSGGGLSGVMETISVPLAVSICFVIYFFLPNGRVPVTGFFPRP